MNKIFIDYRPIEECENEHSYGEICVKCNRCGRFNTNEKENTDNE